MKNLRRMISRSGAFIILGILTVGCQPTQLPNDAELSLSPSLKTVTISSQSEQDGAACLSTGYPYLDVPFIFSLRNAQGSPIGDIPVTFYADWTGQSIGANEGLILMFDFNGDGVTDPATENVSNVGDGLFEQKTHQYSGEVRVTLRLNLSCVYRGELVAFAGGYHTSADFIVELNREPELTPETETETETETEIETEPEPEPTPEPLNDETMEFEV